MALRVWFHSSGALCKHRNYQRLGKILAEKGDLAITAKKIKGQT
jgi:hypothetical protein